MSPWQTLSAASRETFWRSLQTLNVTRIVIALVLLVYLAVDTRHSHIGNQLSGTAYAETCIAYVLASLLFATVTQGWKHRFMWQLSCQILVDIAVISLLYLAAGGARSGLGLLYLFPLAGAAILAPLLLALFSASLATLFLLAESTWQIFMRDQDPPLFQAGLMGAAFFAVVLLVSRLAARLIGQEELAARRGADLKIQQAVYRIVVDDAGDGILVAGHDGVVFAGNPAARRMLGLEDDSIESGAGFRLADVPALEPVAQGFADWLGGVRAEAYVTVKRWQEQAGPVRGRLDQPLHLKLRFARVDTPDGEAERSVIFMQDVSAIENQAQQLKLASMGRLTASIAHEVRNPLSAIGHATSLLAEDLTGPAETRLLRIVGDNVARVNRMVEDILKLSRKVQPGGEPVPLGAFLAELKAEFTETHGLPDNMVYIGDSGHRTVRFDGLHLREVLVNLLGNAIRYASRKPASIRIFPVLDATGRVELHVQDDGPGITPEVRAHLFEPFYTTSSKGTGLGLYLARELCLNNGAMLDYEYRVDGPGGFDAPGRFVITFAA
ncbi:histidine kinase [Massilia sp. WF1]|uniref:sensor histidine kinase n=1 Tax=unclassified Massilia TaxID=2609279 RepID=UPI0006492A02|nr:MULTISPECIES: PAS domain-containing sensor histidine kinase [unclassified Massilia]ALK98879.1 PAS domain-containing sensor histidine kinase [Massilia sp. WG5]KLU38573.1 histidine kinase [Massilia sp. WF1]